MRQGFAFLCRGIASSASPICASPPLRNLPEIAPVLRPRHTQQPFGIETRPRQASRPLASCIAVSPIAKDGDVRLCQRSQCNSLAPLSSREIRATCRRFKSERRVRWRAPSRSGGCALDCFYCAALVGSSVFSRLAHMAGSIPRSGPTAAWRQELKVPPQHLNSEKAPVGTLPF